MKVEKVDILTDSLDEVQAAGSDELVAKVVSGELP